MAEAGWYYVEGDPPGTVRRWNGHEWIGVPIAHPSTPTTMHGQTPRQSPAQNQPLVRSNSNTQRQTVLSLLSFVSFAILAVLFGVLALRTWRGADMLAAANGSVSIGALDEFVADLNPLLLGIIATTVVSTIVFFFWLSAAATAAQVHRVGGLRGNVRREPLSIGMVVLIVFVFGFLLPTIYWLLRTISSEISRGSGGSSRGLFQLVSDTATAASIDPHTGISNIEPIKIMVWWVLWWAPIFVGVIAAVWTMALEPPDAGFMANVLQLSTILLVLEIVSLICIMITIMQINLRLQRS